MLLFCTRQDPVCPPVMKEFEILARTVINNIHLHHRTTVASVDTEHNPDLAARFHVKGHPSIRYVGWGKDLNHLGALALGPRKNAVELHDFLLDHLDDELFIFRTRVMDNLAREFMFSTAEVR